MAVGNVNLFLAISTGNCRNNSSQFKQPFWLLGCLLHWNDKLKEQKLKGHVFNFASSFASPVGDALIYYTHILVLLNCF
jgi:hypothetical protein